jgi:hypothetical protein
MHNLDVIGVLIEASPVLMTGKGNGDLEGLLPSGMSRATALATIWKI